MDWVIHANSLNAEILKPDLTIFIDVDPEICFKRIKLSRTDFEMYEQIDVMKNVRINYFKAFDRLKDSEKIAVVDGNTTPEKVEDSILNEISKLESRS